MDENLFAYIKSVVCACICNVIAESGAKITEEALNDKGNKYTDEIIKIIQKQKKAN